MHRSFQHTAEFYFYEVALLKVWQKQPPQLNYPPHTVPEIVSRNHR